MGLGFRVRASVSMSHRCEVNDLGALGCGVGSATVRRASSSLANSALLRCFCRPGVAGAGAPGEGAGAQHVGELCAAERRQRRRLRLRGGAKRRCAAQVASDCRPIETPRHWSALALAVLGGWRVSQILLLCLHMMC